MHIGIARKHRLHPPAASQPPQSPTAATAQSGESPQRVRLRCIPDGAVVARTSLRIPPWCSLVRRSCQPQQPIEEGTNTIALPRLNFGSQNQPNKPPAQHHLRCGHAPLAAQHYRRECDLIRNIAPSPHWPCGQSSLIHCVMGVQYHRVSPIRLTCTGFARCKPFY